MYKYYTYMYIYSAAYILYDRIYFTNIFYRIYFIEYNVQILYNIYFFNHSMFIRCSRSRHIDEITIDWSLAMFNHVTKARHSATGQCTILLVGMT